MSRFKIKIISKGEIWGDVEWREVDQAGKEKIESDAADGKWGREDRWDSETDSRHTDTRIVDQTTEYYFPEVQEWRTVTDETHTDTRLVGGITEYFFQKEYTITIEDITVQYIDEQRLKNLIAQGDLDKQKCEMALNVIRGHNKANNLTSEQILSMMQSFAQIDLALKSGMPVTAKSLIQAVTVDGIIVTQQMKNDLMGVL